jgi:hypothetical protein
MIYVPTNIKIGLGIQKLVGETQTHRQHGNRVSLFFFQNKEIRANTDNFHGHMCISPFILIANRA